MNESYVVDGHASCVDSVTDFSVLKRLVKADKMGCLFARKVSVECSLLDQPYEEVVTLIGEIAKSQVNFNFVNVESFTIKTLEDWSKLKSTTGLSHIEGHVYSEVEIDTNQFFAMRDLLKQANCLLLDMSKLTKKDVSVNLNGLH